MKTFIGLVGEKGSGKETFVHFLEEIVTAEKIAHIRSSDVLADTLRLWNLPLTRSNLQHVAIVMDNGFGKGTVTTAVAERMRQHPAEIVIFDGVRWHTDAEMIRHFDRNFLIYITAPLNTRYERTRARKEKDGESESSFEQFLKEEQVETEVYIPEIGKTADFTILNEGTLEEMKESVRQVYSKIIS
jgi:dephospho-CoA kinase